MGRRGQSVTLSISDRDKAQLEQIAAEQGMLWGDRPNISRLVEAIARRELLIGRNNDWSDDRIRALQQAMRSLIDTGQLNEAQLLARLLLDRSELALPIRSEIETLLATPSVPWRSEIDQYILLPTALSAHLSRCCRSPLDVYHSPRQNRLSRKAAISRMLVRRN